MKRKLYSKTYNTSKYNNASDCYICDENSSLLMNNNSESSFSNSDISPDGDHRESHTRSIGVQALTKFSKFSQTSLSDDHFICTSNESSCYTLSSTDNNITVPRKTSRVTSNDSHLSDDAQQFEEDTDYHCNSNSSNSVKLTASSNKSNVCIGEVFVKKGHIDEEEEAEDEEIEEYDQDSSNPNNLHFTCNRFNNSSASTNNTRTISSISLKYYKKPQSEFGSSYVNDCSNYKRKKLCLSGNKYISQPVLYKCRKVNSIATSDQKIYDDQINKFACRPPEYLKKYMIRSNSSHENPDSLRSGGINDRPITAPTRSSHSNENYNNIRKIYIPSTINNFNRTNLVRRRYYIVGSRVEIKRFKESQDNFLNPAPRKVIKNCSKHCIHCLFGHDIDQSTIRNRNGDFANWSDYSKTDSSSDDSYSICDMEDKSSSNFYISNNTNKNIPIRKIENTKDCIVCSKNTRLSGGNNDGENNNLSPVKSAIIRLKEFSEKIDTQEKMLKNVEKIGSSVNYRLAKDQECLKTHKILKPKKLSICKLKRKSRKSIHIKQEMEPIFKRQYWIKDGIVEHSKELNKQKNNKCEKSKTILQSSTESMNIIYCEHDGKPEESKNIQAKIKNSPSRTSIKMKNVQTTTVNNSKDSLKKEFDDEKKINSYTQKESIGVEKESSCILNESTRTQTKPEIFDIQKESHNSIRPKSLESDLNNKSCVSINRYVINKRIRGGDSKLLHYKKSSTNRHQKSVGILKKNKYVSTKNIFGGDYVDLCDNKSCKVLNVERYNIKTYAKNYVIHPDESEFHNNDLEVVPLNVNNTLKKNIESIKSSCCYKNSLTLSHGKVKNENKKKSEILVPCKKNIYQHLNNQNKNSKKIKNDDIDAKISMCGQGLGVCLCCSKKTNLNNFEKSCLSIIDYERRSPCMKTYNSSKKFSKNETKKNSTVNKFKNLDYSASNKDTRRNYEELDTHSLHESNSKLFKKRYFKTRPFTENSKKTDLITYDEKLSNKCQEIIKTHYPKHQPQSYTLKLPNNKSVCPLGDELYSCSRLLCSHLEPSLIRTYNKQSKNHEYYSKNEKSEDQDLHANNQSNDIYFKNLESYCEDLKIRNKDSKYKELQLNSKEPVPYSHESNSYNRQLYPSSKTPCFMNEAVCSKYEELLRQESRPCSQKFCYRQGTYGINICNEKDKWNISWKIPETQEKNNGKIDEVPKDYECEKSHKTSLDSWKNYHGHFRDNKKIYDHAELEHVSKGYDCETLQGSSKDCDNEKFQKSSKDYEKKKNFKKAISNCNSHENLRGSLKDYNDEKFEKTSNYYEQKKCAELKNYKNKKLFENSKDYNQVKHDENFRTSDQEKYFKGHDVNNLKSHGEEKYTLKCHDQDKSHEKLKDYAQETSHKHSKGHEKCVERSNYYDEIINDKNLKGNEQENWNENYGWKKCNHNNSRDYNNEKNEVNLEDQEKYSATLECYNQEKSCRFSNLNVSKDYLYENRQFIRDFNTKNCEIFKNYLLKTNVMSADNNDLTNELKSTKSCDSSIRLSSGSNKLNNNSNQFIDKKCVNCNEKYSLGGHHTSRSSVFGNKPLNHTHSKRYSQDHYRDQINRENNKKLTASTNNNNKNSPYKQKTNKLPKLQDYEDIALYLNHVKKCCSKNYGIDSNSRILSRKRNLVSERSLSRNPSGQKVITIKTTLIKDNCSTEPKYNSCLKKVSSVSVKNNSINPNKNKSNYSVKTKSNNSIKKKSNDPSKKRSNDSIRKKSTDCIRKKSNDSIRKKSNDSIRKKSNDSIRKKSNDSIRKKSNDAIRKKSNDAIRKKSNDTTKKRSNDSIKKRSNDSIKKKTNDSIKKRSKRNDVVQNKSSKNHSRRDSTYHIEPKTYRSSRDNFYSSIYNSNSKKCNSSPNPTSSNLTYDLNDSDSFHLSPTHFNSDVCENSQTLSSDTLSYNSNISSSDDDPCITIPIKLGCMMDTSRDSSIHEIDVQSLKMCKNDTCKNEYCSNKCSGRKIENTKSDNTFLWNLSGLKNSFCSKLSELCINPICKQLIGDIDNADSITSYERNNLSLNQTKLPKNISDQSINSTSSAMQSRNMIYDKEQENVDNLFRGSSIRKNSDICDYVSSLASKYDCYQYGKYDKPRLSDSHSKEKLSKRNSQDNLGRKHNKDKTDRRKSKNNVGRKESRGSMGRKQSKDATGKRHNRDSIFKRMRKKKSKDSISSRQSKNSTSSKRSKNSTSSKRSKNSKGSRRSKNSKGSRPSRNSTDSKNSVGSNSTDSQYSFDSTYGKNKKKKNKKKKKFGNWCSRRSSKDNTSKSNKHRRKKHSERKTMNDELKKMNVESHKAHHNKFNDEIYYQDSTENSSTRSSRESLKVNRASTDSINKKKGGRSSVESFKTDTRKIRRSDEIYPEKYLDRRYDLSRSHLRTGPDLKENRSSIYGTTPTNFQHPKKIRCTCSSDKDKPKGRCSATCPGCCHKKIVCKPVLYDDVQSPKSIVSFYCEKKRSSGGANDIENNTHLASITAVNDIKMTNLKSSKNNCQWFMKNLNTRPIVYTAQTKLKKISSIFPYRCIYNDSHSTYATSYNRRPFTKSYKKQSYEKSLNKEPVLYENSSRIRFNYTGESFESKKANTTNSLRNKNYDCASIVQSDFLKNKTKMFCNKIKCTDDTNIRNALSDIENKDTTATPVQFTIEDKLSSNLIKTKSIVSDDLFQNSKRNNYTENFLKYENDIKTFTKLDKDDNDFRVAPINSRISSRTSNYPESSITNLFNDEKNKLIKSSDFLPAASNIDMQKANSIQYIQTENSNSTILSIDMLLEKCGLSKNLNKRKIYDLNIKITKSSELKNLKSDESKLSVKVKKFDPIRTAYQSLTNNNSQLFNIVHPLRMNSQMQKNTKNKDLQGLNIHNNKIDKLIVLAHDHYKDIQIPDGLNKSNNDKLIMIEKKLYPKMDLNTNNENNDSSVSNYQHCEIDNSLFDYFVTDVNPTTSNDSLI